MITLSTIQNLSPCEDRLQNYTTHYSEWSGTLLQFLDLDKVSHQDKVWIFSRLIESNKLSLAAIDFAESVLNTFEQAHPQDNRPRNAINAYRSNVVDSQSVSLAARDAANDAYSAYIFDLDAGLNSILHRAANVAHAVHTAYAIQSSSIRKNERAINSIQSAGRAASAAEMNAQLEIMKQYAAQP